MKKLIAATVWTVTLASTAVYAGGDAAAGKEKAAPCLACHGETGISAAPIYPNIGGQYANYLLHSLQGYKSGERKNAIMQGMVAALSPQDMKDLSAYFASLDGVLKAGTTHP
ncbi:MAG: cytochrome c [Sedimenticolaceae bacterium]